MATIRTDYFTDNRDLLPDWLPDNSLVVKLLRCLVDNYIQDAVYVFHRPYLLPDHAYVLRRRGLSDSVNLIVGSSGVTVPITNRFTDVYDNPLPFAWYDGELLMVFNLHMGHATGGVSYRYWMDNVYRVEVDGIAITLSDHRVGGRAYWNAGKGWKLNHLEPLGLFVPGSFTSIECYYEKRSPFPDVRLGSESLERRSLWTRADEFIRLCGSHRGSMSAGAAYFHKVRGKLPGHHLFGLGCELGLTRVVPYVPLYQPFAVTYRASVAFGEYGARLLRVRYPNTITSIDASEEYAYTSWYFLESAWWDGYPVHVVGALTDEVT